MATYRVIRTGGRSTEVTAIEAKVGESGTLEFYDAQGVLDRAYAANAWIEVEYR